jgi:NAD(P)-dependent dehydrogenase (short-subunit alcohol dehydrogenase family)
MARNLKDMTVVITGASAGIGRELAVELDRRGARLVLAARRLDRLDALNLALGGVHHCIRCDVSIEDDCRSLVGSSVERFGRIDTLVCNAGYGLIRSVHETTREEFEAIIRTNVYGSTDCIRFVVPHMLGNARRDGWRGQIVLVSSAAARRGLVRLGAYAATKGMQLLLAEAMRVELESQSIAVTSVHPIGTESDFFRAAEAISQSRIWTRDRHPVSQTGKAVARKMVGAIRNPVRECWPFWPARFALALNALVPWAGDWAMRRMLKDIKATHRLDERQDANRDRSTGIDPKSR